MTAARPAQITTDSRVTYRGTEYVVTAVAKDRRDGRYYAYLAGRSRLVLVEKLTLA